MPEKQTQWEACNTFPVKDTPSQVLEVLEPRVISDVIVLRQLGQFSGHEASEDLMVGQQTHLSAVASWHKRPFGVLPHRSHNGSDLLVEQQGCGVCLLHVETSKLSNDQSNLKRVKKRVVIAFDRAAQRFVMAISALSPCAVSTAHTCRPARALCRSGRCVFGSDLAVFLFLSHACNVEWGVAATYKVLHSFGI